MKKYNLLILILILTVSCTKRNDVILLRSELNELKNSHKSLDKELDSIKKLYVMPFKLYESIVINEKELEPDSIIHDYKQLIDKYPNSFWKHESEIRIKNIEMRKKYWTKKDGWKLDDFPKKPLVDEQTISCPGC